MKYVATTALQAAVIVSSTKCNAFLFVLVCFFSHKL